MNSIYVKIYWLSYIAILFPYTSLIFMGTDVSPMYIFLLGLCFVFLNKIVLTSKLKLLYFVLLIFISFGVLSIIVGIFSNKFVLLRYGAGYILFPYVLVLFYTMGKIIAKVNFKKYVYKLKIIILYSLYIWLSFAILQLFFKLQGSYLGFEISNYFVTSDISHRISMNRGILSLAVEPSYLGLTSSIFLTFVYFLNKLKYLTKYEYRQMVAILLFLIIASMSIVSFVSLFFVLLAILLSERNIKSLYSLSILFLGIILLYFSFEDAIYNTRLISVVYKIIENPEFLIIDLSSASRAAAIIAPQMTLGLDNSWAGNLLSEQNKVLIKAVSLLKNDAAYYLTLGVENSAKIKSTYGVFTFQFGIFGIIAIGIFYYAIFNLFKGYNRFLFPFVVAFTIAYIIQVPLSYPLIPGLIGIMLVLIDNDKFNNKGKKCNV